MAWGRRPLLSGALAAAACIPDGPDRFRGPRYEVTLAPRDAAAAPDPDDASHDGDAPEAAAPDDAGEPPEVAAPPVSRCSVRATTRAPEGEYANAYVCALWIEDGAGGLVRTLAYFASVRARYLFRYQEARAGEPIDVTTRATVNLSESKLAGRDVVSHELTWDLDDRAGERVPADGTYTLRIETTSFNGQGPVVDVPLPLADGPFTRELDDQGNISGVSVTCE